MIEAQIAADQESKARKERKRLALQLEEEKKIEE